jgi:hypothetical protein
MMRTLDLWPAAAPVHEVRLYAITMACCVCLQLIMDSRGRSSGQEFRHPPWCRNEASSIILPPTRSLLCNMNVQSLVSVRPWSCKELLSGRRRHRLKDTDRDQHCKQHPNYTSRRTTTATTTAPAASNISSHSGQRLILSLSLSLSHTHTHTHTQHVSAAPLLDLELQNPTTQNNKKTASSNWTPKPPQLKTTKNCCSYWSRTPQLAENNKNCCSRWTLELHN